MFANKSIKKFIMELDMEIICARSDMLLFRIFGLEGAFESLYKEYSL